MTRSRSLWALMAFLAAGVALFSYRYLIGGPFLAPNVVANLFVRPWLPLHVAGAATALLLGPLNLLPAVRRRWPVAHRWIGRTYIVSCLGAGAAGFVLAFGSTAGPIATVGFGSLAVAWIFANAEGWRSAQGRRFAGHRAWMLRSYAMTFGAVMLRVYLGLFAVLHVPFMDGYRASSYLAWIPNLILVELYLRGAFAAGSGKARAPRAAAATP